MAKRISKRDSLITRSGYGRGAVFMGLIFVPLGGFFALVGFRVVTVPAMGDANAPWWVVGCVGLAFALAGLMVGVSGVRGVLHRRRRAAPLEGRRDGPWLKDYPWEPRGVRDRAGARVFQGVVGTLFFAVFLAPFNWWAWVSDEGGFMVQAIVGLFDLILLAVVGTFLYRLAQFAKYGHSRLRFRSFPFHPGAALAVDFSPNRFETLRCTLRFVEEGFETRGHGKNRSQQQVCLEHFAATKILDVRPTDAEVRIEFDLPDNPEWKNDLAGPSLRYWELVVAAEVPGIDFETSFPLPVYARDGAEETVACPA